MADNTQNSGQSAPKPEEEQPQQAAQPDEGAATAPPRTALERFEQLEEQIAASESKMAKILAAMSKQFTPDQIFAIRLPRALLFLLAGWLCFLVQTLSMNMFQNNMPQLEGYYQGTLVETTWLISAYMAPYASFTILLIKIRTQIGTRRFTFISFACFIIGCCLETQFSDYNSALLLRFLSGLTTAPISSIGILYTIEPFVPTRKVSLGISLCMMYIALGTPLARIVCPFLVEDAAVASFYVFMAGLACLAVALLYFLPVTPLPQAKVLEKTDFISFPLLALALGLNAAMMPVGKYYWWRDAPWIGAVFAVALFCLIAALLIELNRKTPMIDFRWLFSPQMLHITLVMLTFRILISDQVGLLSYYFSSFGLQNPQLISIYMCIGAGIIAGGLLCFVFLKPGGGDNLYLLGSLAVAIGSFADSFSTSLTRPVDMYVTQGLIGFGTSLFMAVSFSKGMLAALTAGKPQYLTSFSAAFLFTQSTGGLTGSAFFGTLQIYFEKFHSYILTQHLTLTDSQVAARVSVLGRSYSGALTDPALARAEGLAALAKQATLEANVLAYNDVFRIYGYIALTLFCLLILRIIIKAYFLRLAAKSVSAPATAAQAA